MPPSQVEKPGSEWPPPRTATIRSSLRAKSTARITSGDAGAADDQRRAPVVGAVPDRARLVVAVVAGPDEPAAQALLELGDRGLAERVVSDRVRCHAFGSLREVVVRAQPSRRGLSAA